jgi:DNA-binding transcriptional MerR regulator
MTGEQTARGQFGIGEVLAQLQPEFPDISTSKIRFLEAEGLIEPARSRSGYRRFSAADIERLRYILTMQRDSYLPLRVIRERLADGEEGADGQSPADRSPADMTRRQLLDAAEISEAELTELGAAARPRLRIRGPRSLGSGRIRSRSGLGRPRSRGAAVGLRAITGVPWQREWWPAEVPPGT